MHLDKADPDTIGLVMQKRYFSAIFFAVALAFLHPCVLAARPSPPPPDTTAPQGFPGTPLHELLVRQWTLQDGIPTETITDVLQAQDGFLWMTTFQGLLRFDGHHFELFDKPRILARRGKNGALDLNSENFTTLREDEHGVLWFGNEAGELVRLEDGYFEIYPVAESVLWDLWIENPEDLWIATSPPLHGTPDGVMENIELPGLKKVTADSLLHHAGSFWIGTGTQGLIELRGDGSHRIYNVEDGLAGRGVNALTPGCDDSIWVGHWDGLSRLWFEKEEVSIQTFPELTATSVHRLILDASCDLWMATSIGLGRISAQGKIEWFDPSRGGPPNLYSLAFDHEGNLWTTGVRGGLFRFKNPSLGRITHHDGLPEGSVEALVQRRDGTIWATSSQGSIIPIDDGKALSPISLPDLATTRPTVLFEDSQENLWVGSVQGLVRIDSEGRQHFYSEENGLPTPLIRAVYEDSFGTLWIGTGYRGLIKLQGNSWESISLGDDESFSFVFAIDEDRDGNLLFAFRGGFQIYSPKDGSLQSYRSGRDFPGGSVFTVYADSEGVLWLSTDAGLVRMRPDGSFDTLAKDRGFPVNKVFDYLEDDIGQAWICTGKGILRAKKADLVSFLDGKTSDLKIETLDQEDGMPHLQCTGARQILATREGQLFFPTHGGIAYVRPARTDREVAAPPVMLTRFEIDGEQTDIDPEATLQVPPGPHRYLFDFAVLGFRNPSKNRARYRLLGYESTWHEVDNERRAVYTNLPPRDYVFEVMGTDEGNIWSENPVQQTFVVKPFYYETRLFQVGAVLVIGMLILGIYRRRLRIIEARHQAEREVSEERRLLLDQLKARNEEIDRYLYLFAHDLKNPLVTIRSFSGMTEKDLADGRPDRARKAIAQVNEAADQMNQQLDDLLKLAEVGRTRVTSGVLDLDAMFRTAITEIQPLLQTHGVTIAIPEPLPKVIGVRHQIGEVIDELLENALKYLGEIKQPKIEIRAVRRDYEAEIRVSDNGIGIPVEYREKVFQLLHQLDRSSSGTGVGLAFVRRVVEEHFGKAWIETNEPEGGTTVCFTLPLGTRPRT